MQKPTETDPTAGWPRATRATRGDLRFAYHNLAVIALKTADAECKAIEAREVLFLNGPIAAKPYIVAMEKSFRELRETVEIARHQIALSVPNPNKLLSRPA